LGHRQLDLQITFSNTPHGASELEKKRFTTPVFIPH
jgi:hypothetical protein